MSITIDDHEDAELLAHLLKVPLQSALDRESREAVTLIRGMISKLENKINPKLNDDEVIVAQQLLQTMQNRIGLMGGEERDNLDRLTLMLNPPRTMAS